ncbi:MAG: hypothetical protein ABIY56_09385 [Dokdonella sp.]
MLTTFTSYGEVAAARQDEIIHALCTNVSGVSASSTDEVAEAVVNKMLAMGLVQTTK